MTFLGNVLAHGFMGEQNPAPEIASGRRCLFAVDLNIDLFFFSSIRLHTRYWRDWSSDVCSSDLFFDLPRYIKESRAAAEKSLAAVLDPNWSKIGRASLGKECRSRWSPYH